MRSLLCDADVPFRVVGALQQLNVPVLSVTSIPNTADDDFRVVEAAHSLNAILVTLDRDFTTSQPLFAAMVELGARVVRLRPAKCSADMVVQTLAVMILNNHRRWQELLDQEPGLVSCTPDGNRFRQLSDFPWYKKSQ